MKRFSLISTIRHILNKRHDRPINNWKEDVMLDWDFYAHKANLDMLGYPKFQDRQILMDDPINCWGKEIHELVWQAVQMSVRLYEKGLIDKTDVIWVKANDAWWPSVGRTLEEVKDYVSLHIEAQRKEYEMSEEYKQRNERAQAEENDAIAKLDRILYLAENQLNLTYKDILNHAASVLDCCERIPKHKVPFVRIFNAFALHGFATGAHAGKVALHTSTEKIEYIVGQLMHFARKESHCPEILLTWAKEAVKEISDTKEE